MCMILDNDSWGDFSKHKENMKPIHNWLKKRNGTLVYSNHSAFRELSIRYQRSLILYVRDGKAKIIPKENVAREIQKIKKAYTLKSNDPHIIALAKASNTTVLCTKDKKLQIDFKKIIRKGKIYKTQSHRHLLTTNLCR